MPTLSRDVTIVYAGAEITIPKGTRLLIVPGGGGEVHFAVESQALLTRLTGNTHDPKYRYAFVPADAVEHLAQAPATGSPVAVTIASDYVIEQICADLNKPESV